MTIGKQDLAAMDHCPDAGDLKEGAHPQGFDAQKRTADEADTQPVL